MSPLLFVHKHPNPRTLYVARCNLPADADPQQWVQMTEDDLEAWKTAQLAAGWVPAPVDPESPAVPDSVTAAQLEQWLHDNGKHAAVLAAIDAIQPETARLKVKARWNRETKFDRSDELLNQMAAAIGMTSEQVDQAFREAATNYP